MMYNNDEFKRPIILKGTRILRPREYQRLLDGCPKIDYKTMLQALLYTGMRYVEMQRFQKHPDWFDGEFIHLPPEASLKKKRKQRERWVRLNNQGKMIIGYFLNVKTRMPSYQSWNMNLGCWAKRAFINPEGISVKSTRKTWESWLMFCYPQVMAMIILSQGHTQIISIQHYINMPFTEADRNEILKYVEGWI